MIREIASFETSGKNTIETTPRKRENKTRLLEDQTKAVVSQNEKDSLTIVFKKVYLFMKITVKHSIIY